MAAAADSAPMPKAAAAGPKLPLSGPVYVFKPPRFGSGGKWKMRYCTLTPGLLTYTREKKSAVTLTLGKALVTYPKAVEPGCPSDFVIEVLGDNAGWRLCFTGSAQRDAWSQALKRASEPIAVGDGSSGGAPTIPQTPGMSVDTIPTRFMEAVNNDIVEARRRWRLTHQWRAENNMDKILYEGFGEYVDFMKTSYRHFFHKRAKNGHVVYYERMDPKKYSSLVERVGKERLIRYYMFISEYCYEELELNDPGGRMVNVYDLSYLTFSSLFGASCNMAKEVVQLCAAHYPERADKVFIINAPKFFSTLWTIISPLLDPRTHAKINISTDDRTALLEYIEADCVPVEYGGTDPTPIGQAKEELMFMAWIDKHCGGTGSGSRQPIITPVEQAPPPAPVKTTPASPYGKASVAVLLAVMLVVVRNVVDVRAFICARVCDN